MYDNENFNPYEQPYSYEPTYEQPEAGGMTEPPKPPKKKKKAGKVWAAIGCAVALGAVAGATMYGVNYAGQTFFPPETVNTAGNDYNKDTGVTVEAKQESVINTNKINTTVDLKATVMDVSEIVEAVLPSVVAINGTYTSYYNYGMFGTQTYESTVSGSGIIIGTNESELLVVTNAHVVSDVDDLAVTFYDGSKVDAVIKGMKSENDLAVLAIELKDIPKDAIYRIATLGDSSEIKVGEAAIAVGNSMGYGISVTTGIISALNRSVTVEDVVYENLIQTDAAINPGNSGGALFNASGEVIGINSVKMSNTQVEGMGYAISISSVKEIIDELTSRETRRKLSDDERGYLGVTGVSITNDISNNYGYPIGVLVRSVASGSAADLAGIKKNDIIVSFDGESISTYDALYEKMFYYAVGEEIEVEYYHLDEQGEYELQTTTVTLTEKISG